MDPKGRLSLPARHRRTAAQHGGGRLWAMPGFEECRVILDDEGFNAYADRMRAVPGNAEDARAFERTLFRRTAELEPDQQGRVLLPEHLRRYAGLDRDVLILGANGRVELWNPDRFKSYEASHSRSMAELAKSLVF